MLPAFHTILTIGWYEWYPDFSHDFTGIQFSAGDTITLAVSANSTTSGNVLIKNTSTGQSVNHILTSTSALCQTSAEWIVEDYRLGAETVPLANFETVKFTGAQVVARNEVLGPEGANLINVVNAAGNILTETQIDPTSVTVTYQ